MRKFFYPISLLLIFFVICENYTAAQSQLSLKNFAVFGGDSTASFTDSSESGIEVGSNVTFRGGGDIGTQTFLRFGNLDSIDASAYGNIVKIDTAFALIGGSMYVFNRQSYKFNVLYEGPLPQYWAPGNITVNGNSFINQLEGGIAGQVVHPNSYTYNGPLPDGGEIQTDSNIALIFPQMPEMPPPTAFSDTGLINLYSTQTITPGLYGTMNLDIQQTLTFSGPGIYIFNSISNLSNDTLRFDFKNEATGSIRIYVWGNVDLNSINVDIVNGGSASRIYVESHGSSFTINANAANDSRWAGTIYVPNGTFRIGSVSLYSHINIFSGSVWSRKQVTIGNNTSFTFVPLSSSADPAPNSFIFPYYTPPADGKTTTVIGSELTSLNENTGVITNDSIIYRINGDSVYIEAIAIQGQYAATLAFLQANGLTNIIDNGPGSLIITGSIPIANLKLLNARPDLIDYARPLFPPLNNSGVVATRGDTAISSNLVRTGYNLTGEGVKIGVISDSYNTIPGDYAAIDVSNGDLPGDGNPDGDTAVVQRLAEYPFGQSIDEGRAMLQIVHDIAPKAKLAFRTGFVSAGDFAQGIGELTSAGCNVIVDDITYMTEPFFKDGVVAKAVDNVVAAGTTYFSAAGNFGKKSYEGMFNGMPAPASLRRITGTVHDFGGSNPFQSLNLTPGNYTIVLQWDDDIYSVGDPSAGTQTDLDIFLTDDLGATLFGFNRNNIGNDPIEVLPFTVTAVTTANLIIGKASGPDVKFKYIVFRGNLTINDYAGSSTLVGQANSAGAIAVGAVLYSNTPPYGLPIPTIASFSSVGGDEVNGEVRMKPNLTAPNGVNTTVNFNNVNIDDDDFPNFFGTSAAAPHAAAAAALIIQGKQKYLGETITPSDLRTLLQNTAIDMDVPDYDVSTGYGFIQPFAAMQTFASPIPEIDSLVTDDPVTRPVTAPFTVTIKGKGLNPETKVYLRGEAIASHFVDNETVTAEIPPFTDNPPVQLFNPSIIPEANRTDSIDGGFSDSLFFFPKKKHVVVTPDNKTKKYGEKLPPFTASITIDGVPIANTTLTPADLKLDQLTFTTSATTSSNVANYYIHITDPLNPHDPDDLTLLTKYSYEFVQDGGLLNIGKLPLKITPRDTTLTYGEKIHGIHYNYLLDPSADLQNRDSLSNSIQLDYAASVPDSILAVLSGKGATSRALVNGDLLNLSIMMSSGSGATSRALVNSASGTPQTTYIVDVDVNSMFNYLDNPASSVLVNGKGATSRALVNTGPLINGTASVLVNGQGATSRALVNGDPTLLNSTTSNSTSNSNVAVVVSLTDAPDPANNAILAQPVNMITDDITTGIHTIIPAAFISGNYELTYGLGTLIINKAPLTITADTKNIASGEALPVFTSDIKGFQYQDADTPRTGPVYALSPAYTADPGVYTITPSALSFDGDSNYTKIYVNGLLHVNTEKYDRRILVSLKCVEKINNGPHGLGYVAHYRAWNRNSTSYSIPPGPNNSLRGLGKFSGVPPTLFPNGVTDFDVYFDGRILIWTLKTPVRRRLTTDIAIASAFSRRCREDNTSQSFSAAETSSGKSTLSKTGLYPNPATTKLMITSTIPLLNKQSIMVFDAMGRIMPVSVVIKSEQSAELNVSRLSSGVYYIKIRQDKTTTTTLSFIKL